MITLHALGNAEIETRVTTITPSQEIVFGAALYLILERGQRVSRRRLTSLLWPRAADKVGAHRLRQTILQLKKLGVIVQADRNNLQLLQHDARSDVDSLSTTNASLPTGSGSMEFLPGYAPRCSESFRDWVDTRKGEIHAALTRILLRDLEKARLKGDWIGVERISAQCLVLDSLNETAVLAQAEATAMRGAKTTAVAILDQYIADVEGVNLDLRLPPTLLRRRIVKRVPEQATLSLRESAFVGRDHEMEALMSLLAAARSGNGGACLITGDAGIGKTRLTSELVKFAELDGVNTKRSVCRRFDVDRPLSVFADLVPHLRELPGGLGCAQETLSVLRRLTEFDGQASDDHLIDGATVSYAQMRLALFDLFDAITEDQCLLVVLEDVQWLDTSSGKLLSAMVPWAKAKKLIFLLNERSASSVASTQISQFDAPKLELAPLAPAFAKTLVGAMMNEASALVPSDVIDWLLSVGEGNPLFLEELGKQWLETGKQHEFPPSISAVVDDRLSRLSCDALQVLQTCAVLGVNATIDRVERVLEIKSHRLLSSIQELSVAGMLQEEGNTLPDISEQLNTRHDLLAIAALRRLARKPLALLHRRAGTVLERESIRNSASTSLLWACAFHWRHAGDRERAFRAALSCAEHLLEAGLPFDAAQALERVLEYCVTDEQRLLVLPRLAVSLQMQGQWERSVQILRRARQIRTQTDPSANVHDEVELALFDAAWRGSLDHSTLLREIRACVGSIDAPLIHRVGCGLLGLKVASAMTEISVMKELYQTILPLLNDSRVPPATRPQVDMIFHSICGDAHTAAEATEQFLEIARADQTLLTFASALANAGVAKRLAGRKEEAEKLFIESLDYSIAHGLTGRATFAAHSLVRVYLAAGEIQNARAMMERADLITYPAGDVHLIADQLYLAARISLEEGNIQDASSKYELIVAETRANQMLNRRTAVLALGIRIEILEAPSYEKLWPLVAELEAGHLILRGGGWQDFEAHALYLGLSACGKAARANMLLTEYATIYRLEKWPLPRNLEELLSSAKCTSNHPQTDYQESAGHQL